MKTCIRFTRDANKLKMIPAMERVCLAYRALRTGIAGRRISQGHRDYLVAYGTMYSGLLVKFGPHWSGLFDAWISAELSKKKTGRGQYNAVIKFHEKLANLDPYMAETHPALPEAVFAASSFLKDQAALLAKYASPA